MAARHKAIKAILEVGHASEWNDDHISDFTDEVTDEDMLLGAAVTASWDTAQTSGGSAPVWSVVGAAGQGHAFVVLNTGGATGNISSMRHKLGGAASNITSPDDLPVVTCALEVAAVHTSGTVAEWGLFASATSPFTANQAGAYFRIKDGNLYAVAGNGAAETATLIGAVGQYSQYRVEVLDTTVKFYVDDMVYAKTAIALTRPAVDLTMKFSVISANDVDSTLRLDAVGLQRLRKR